jgi:hypothetical protein
MPGCRHPCLLPEIVKFLLQISLNKVQGQPALYRQRINIDHPTGKVL